MIIIVHLIRFNAATIYSYAKLCRIRIKGDGVNGKRERELFVLLCKYINVTRINYNYVPQFVNFVRMRKDNLLL